MNPNYVHEPDCTRIIRLRVDPFRAEIYGERIEKLMCDCYYQMLCWEI